jgi:hypothetical protein
MPEEYDAPKDHPEFFRKQAEHCRWLARNTTDPNTVAQLNALARDFDERAAAMEGAQTSD